MRYLKALEIQNQWFWTVVSILILVKLALVSDLSVQINYAPHDDGLYVSRAFYLLSGEAFGPYDARMLVKYPGMSFWLAGIRVLGVPYLYSINLFYIAAGIYFIVGLLRSGFNRTLLVIAFAIYLFNPVTLTEEWIRLFREPLATSLLVVMLAAMMFVLKGIRRGQFLSIHLLTFVLVFAFALLVREEDRLLYALLLLFYTIVLWQAKIHGGFKSAGSRVGIILVVALPLIAASVNDAAVRSFIARHYGLPILHDLGEGEFPKLIAAMRSVESKKDNRLVMITQEALGKLLVEAPKLAPVINRLPRPGLGTYSCQRYGVCSEWANGWTPFWIKDAAFEAGLTPDLPSAQAYFRSARLDVEQACKEGRLKCRDKGGGLFPPFELRWTRAYVQEWTNLVKMTLAPDLHPIDRQPLNYNVDLNFGRIYQAVTMTHQFDAQLQSSPHGESTLAQLENPIGSWRLPIANFYQRYAIFLEMAGMLAFLLRWKLWRAVPPTPFLLVATLFTVYTAVRLAALSYLAVFMGFFEPRLIFSTYTFVLLISLLLIADAINAILLSRPTHD